MASLPHIVFKFTFFDDSLTEVFFTQYKGRLGTTKLKTVETVFTSRPLTEPTSHACIRGREEREAVALMLPRIVGLWLTLALQYLQRKLRECLQSKLVSPPKIPRSVASKKGSIVVRPSKNKQM